MPWVASPAATARYFDRHRMTPKTSIGPDTVMKVRIRGISSQMNRFRYLYGIILGELLLKHANNLRVEICSTRRFCHERQQLKVVDEAVETLNGIRGDEQVDLYILDKGD